MNVFDKHQLRIAKDTLKMSDAGALIMGGMTKDQAWKIIQKLQPTDRFRNTQVNKDSEVGYSR